MNVSLSLTNKKSAQNYALGSAKIQNLRGRDCAARMIMKIV